MEGEEQQTDNVELVKRMSNLQNHGRNSACKRISDGFVERMEALFVRFVHRCVVQLQSDACLLLIRKLYVDQKMARENLLFVSTLTRAVSLFNLRNNNDDTRFL